MMAPLCVAAGALLVVSGAVEIDRWVVPPAVAAAVFSVVAIAPPVSTAGLEGGPRVEAIEPAVAGRPMPVRVTWQQRDGTFRAPRSAVFRVSDATGLVRDLRPELTAGAAWATARVDIPPGAASARLSLAAEGRSVRLEVPIDAEPAGDPIGRVDGGGEAAVAAAEGNLLPEVPGTILVRAPGAASVALLPDLDGVAVEPARAVPGACGVASFRVTVAGLGAPVTVAITRADGTELRVSRRLPLSPGGLSLQRDGGAVLVTHGFAGMAVHVLGGDARGVRWWAARRLERRDDLGVARVELPGDVAWVSASLDPMFGDAAAPALSAEAVADACATDGPSRRWFGVRTMPRGGARVRLLHDGAARAAGIVARRVVRMRTIALGCLAGAVLLEIALVVGFGLRRDPTESAEVARMRRGRVAPLLAGAALMLVLGFALALAATLQFDVP